MWAEEARFWKAHREKPGKSTYPESQSLPILARGLTLACVVLLALFPVQSDDIFMYLAIARRFFETGAFPKTDPFLFSLPDFHWQIWIEWLSYFFWYGGYKLAGFTGLILQKTAVLVATASLPLWLAHKLKNKSPLVPLLVLASSV